MLNRKKKIVVLTDWFLPGYKAGGPIQSCANFSFAMRQHYEVFVVTTDRDFGESQPYPNGVSNEWVTLEGVRIFYFSKQELNYRNLRTVLHTIQPDFIYLNHLFSPLFVIFPLWMWWRKQISGELVLCPRGALFDSALHHKNKYAKKIVVIMLLRWLGIYKNIRFHATNEREKQAINHFFPTDKVVVANNLPNSFQTPFGGLTKEKGRLKLIFIARIVPIKNLLFVLDLLQRVKSFVEFTIIGPIEDAGYWKECEAKIKILPANIKVSWVGAKANTELQGWLKDHHLYILPTMGENFGHSIFEAFLAGRPVVISDQTPWLQLEAKQVGWDISLNASEQFASVLEKVASWDQNEFEQWGLRAWKFANSFIQESSEISQYKKLFS